MISGVWQEGTKTSLTSQTFSQPRFLCLKQVHIWGGADWTEAQSCFHITAHLPWYFTQLSLSGEKTIYIGRHHHWFHFPGSVPLSDSETFLLHTAQYSSMQSFLSFIDSQEGLWSINWNLLTHIQILCHLIKGADTHVFIYDCWCADRISSSQV